MKQIDSILKNYKDLENKDEAKKLLYKELIKKSIIYLAILIFMLIFGIIGSSRTSKLSSIPVSVFITTIIFTTAFTILSLISFIVIKVKSKEEEESIKKHVIIYQIFDNISFIIVLFNILLFIVLFILTPATVSGRSMEPTFYDEDRILVYDVFYKERKDDVVIVDNEGAKYTYDDVSFLIKRVVATSGDKLTYVDNALYVNGTYVESISSYEFQVLLTDKSLDKYFADGIVPEGYVLVMGDNRGNSQDSRRFGLVNSDDILGKVVFKVYPFSSIGLIK